MLKRARLPIALLCTLWTCACVADPAVWEVKGRYNTVYLVGTIHMLSNDEPLPGNILRAYRDSKRLLMEINTNDMDPLATQAATLTLGMLPEGQTLSSRLNADTNKKLKAAAGKLGLDAGMLESFQPWLAALTLQQLQFMQLGYAADAGVEMQLTELATADHKSIEGFETLQQQLQLFAQLDANAQHALLKQTLEELDTAATELTAMMAAWHSGNDAALQKTLQQGMSDDPELYTALTTTRNRHWIEAMRPVLDQQHDNYLVAVGALHLLGNDGLVALLKRAGYSVTRH